MHKLIIGIICVVILVTLAILGLFSVPAREMASRVMVFMKKTCGRAKSMSKKALKRIAKERDDVADDIFSEMRVMDRRTMRYTDPVA
jgi:hypothetical protein